MFSKHIISSRKLLIHYNRILSIITQEFEKLKYAFSELTLHDHRY